MKKRGCSAEQSNSVFSAEQIVGILERNVFCTSFGKLRKKSNSVLGCDRCERVLGEK